MLAKDGAEAVEIYAANRSAVDLVILDMVMPKRTGTEAYGSMKRMSPDLPCILITGYSSAMAPGIEEAAALTVLNKPLSLKELATEVRMALDRAKPDGAKRKA
jgi:DNA-binding NtrC family response regulator